MKQISFILLFVLAGKTYAQNYIETDRQNILGSMYAEQEKYDSAEKYYRKALQLIPDKKRFGPYFILITIAYKNNDAKKLAEYFSELSCIYPKDSILPHIKDYVDLVIDIVIFNKLYHPRCVLKEEMKYANSHPKAVDSTIAALRDRDQDVRARVNKKRGHMTEDEIASFEKEMKFIDSTNFLMLYDCIKSTAFRTLTRR